MPTYTRPYVSESGRLSDLIRQRGRDQAEALLRSGDIQAQMWGNIGNSISSALLGYAKEKQEAPIRTQEAKIRENTIKTGEAELGAAKKATEDKQILGAAMTSTIDPATVESQLAEMGHADLVPVFRRSWQDAEVAKNTLMKTRKDAQDAQDDYLGALAAGIKPFMGGPDGGMNAVQMALQHAKEVGFNVDEIAQQIQANPTQLPTLLDSLIQKSPTQRKLLGEEADRALKTKQEDRALAQMQATAADRDADNAREDAKAVEDRRHHRALEAKPPAGGFQAKEVLGDDGKPVMGTFDPHTRAWTDPSGKPINNPRPVPSAMEMMDSRKFDKAAPVLKSIDELSERINTWQGLIAKAKGGVEKTKAKANYNDDVAEYQALVSGFTPLVARSLGHTGVLTQQDVDSVKELFPKPGDSKTLRDRKVARIQSILGELEATERPGATHGGSADAYDEYLKRQGASGAR